MFWDESAHISYRPLPLTPLLPLLLWLMFSCMHAAADNLLWATAAAAASQVPCMLLLLLLLLPLLLPLLLLRG